MKTINRRKPVVYHEVVDTAEEQNEGSQQGLDFELGELVGKHVHVIQWGDNHAQIHCPACGRHDARVFLDSCKPRVFCFSANCERANRAVNAELAKEAEDLLGLHGMYHQQTPAEKAKAERGKFLWAISRGAEKRLLPILLKNRLPLSEWEAASPVPVTKYEVRSHWKLFLMALFEPTDTVWVGEPHESRCPANSFNFKTVAEWLHLRGPVGPQVSVATFHVTRPYITGELQYLHEAGSRSGEWVCKKDYFVAESDPDPGSRRGLTHDEFGPVISWIARRTVLRAIIDTGNKSLHALFDIPRPPLPTAPRCPQGAAESTSDERMEQWRKWRETYRKEIARDERRRKRHFLEQQEFVATLRGLQCDPAMLRESTLTTRLPGWTSRRNRAGELTGKPQKLIYLNPRYPVTL